MQNQMERFLVGAILSKSALDENEYEGGVR